MNIILWIVLWTLAGWIASLIMGNGGRSWIVNIVIGILGAALGGYLATLAGLGGVTGFNLYSLLVAVAGACLLLAIFNLLRRSL